MTVIKKYGNRRLYDTDRSRYVNLDELTAMIRAGTEVKVVDADTGAELTREVLLQIVIEVLKGGDLLPTGFLRRIIRATVDDPAHELMRRRIASGLEVLAAQMDQLEALFGAVPPPVPGTSTRQAAEPEKAEEDPELVALRQKLAELEGRLRR